MTQRDLIVALGIAALTLVIWLSAVFEKEFNVTVINTDYEPIEYVTTRFPGYYFRMGILRPRSKGGGGGSTYMRHAGPWPKSIEIEWALEDDPTRVFKREIAVAGSMRAGYGELLELIIEFSQKEIRAYPRVRESLSEGLKYRYPDGWRPVD